MTWTAGKDASTTRVAAWLCSTLIWPTTSTSRSSKPTRRAPTPSKSPILRTLWSPRSRTFFPRSPPWLTVWPKWVREVDAHIPPPEEDASLHVICGWTLSLKSNLARGSRVRNFRISNRHSDQSGPCLDTCEPLKASICRHTALRHPSNGRLNMETYTRPPHTTWSWRWETTSWEQSFRAAAEYFRSLHSRG